MKNSDPTSPNLESWSETLDKVSSDELLRTAVLQSGNAEAIADLERVIVATTFENLPGWFFALIDTGDEEFYEILACDLAGHHKRARGTDLDKLIRDLQTHAAQVIASSRKSPNT